MGFTLLQDYMHMGAHFHVSSSTDKFMILTYFLNIVISCLFRCSWLSNLFISSMQSSWTRIWWCTTRPKTSPAKLPVQISLRSWARLSMCSPIRQERLPVTSWCSRSFQRSSLHSQSPKQKAYQIHPQHWLVFGRTPTIATSISDKYHSTLSSPITEAQQYNPHQITELKDQVHHLKNSSSKALMKTRLRRLSRISTDLPWRTSRKSFPKN